MLTRMSGLYGSHSRPPPLMIFSGRKMSLLVCGCSIRRWELSWTSVESFEAFERGMRNRLFPPVSSSTNWALCVDGGALEGCPWVCGPLARWNSLVLSVGEVDDVREELVIFFPISFSRLRFFNFLLLRRRFLKRSFFFLFCLRFFLFLDLAGLVFSGEGIRSECLLFRRSVLSSSVELLCCWVEYTWRRERGNVFWLCYNFPRR